MPTAIITGASSGLGLSIAKHLADRGYNIVATSRTIHDKHPALGQIAAPGVLAVPGDVGDSATAPRVFQAAVERFGEIDLLVNNAGVFIPKPFAQYEADDLDMLILTNLYGFLHFTRQAVEHMADQGHGHIVNIITSLAENPIKAVPCAVPILTKGGINAATRALALELADQNIRVNAVSPGIIKTPMHPEENHAFLDTLQPVGRMGDPEDIARAVLYLQDAGFVTGEILHVDGGAAVGRW